MCDCKAELIEWQAAVEGRLKALERAFDEEREDRYRVMGHLHVAVEEVRSAMRRLEEWCATADGDVRQVKSSLRAASGALRSVN